MSDDAVAPRVALFVTCMVESLYPQTGMSAVQVLERHGARVVVPEGQTCCGQPAFNSGFRDDARRVARHFLDVFGPGVERGDIDAIVTPSGSCAAMVKHSFAVLFEAAPHVADAERARRLAAVTFELSEYLVDVLGVSDPRASWAGRVTYQPCCHLLREMGVDAQPRELLSHLDQADMVVLPGATECCGFGGLFALKNAEISTAMGRRKLANLAACHADTVVVSDVSCMTHLNGLLERQGRDCRAVHIADVLAGTAPGASGRRT